jgi:hypothetical protein
VERLSKHAYLKCGQGWIPINFSAGFDELMKRLEYVTKSGGENYTK